MPRLILATDGATGGINGYLVSFSRAGVIKCYPRIAEAFEVPATAEYFDECLRALSRLFIEPDRNMQQLFDPAFTVSRRMTLFELGLMRVEEMPWIPGVVLSGIPRRHAAWIVYDSTED